MKTFIQVEYDPNYFGGDYNGVGETVLLPSDGLTDENLPLRFLAATGLDPIHIVHYSFDDLFDENGDFAD